LLGATLGAWLAAGQLVHAHAPPQVFQILWRDAADGVVLLTNRGLIFGSEDATRWRLLCNEALNVGVYDRPGLTQLDDGRLLISTIVGLKASADEGCSWQAVEPLGALQTTALAADRSQPARVYVATYAPGEGGIWRSDDGALSWMRVLAVEDNDFLRALRVVPGAPDRVYGSGSVFDDAGNFAHYVVRSSDAGETWERFDVPVLEHELDVIVLAVHPGDPDVVLARATSVEPLAMPDRLLVSRDGGESFASPLEVVSLADAAFGADGGVVWVAGLEGVWRSSDGGASFEPVGMAATMSHVVEHEGMLFAAGRHDGLAAGRDGVGVSSDGGEHFTAWMALNEVREPIACEPDSQAAIACRTPWLDWEREVLRPVAPPVDGGTSPPDAAAPDAGGRDAAADVDASRAPRGESDGGCSCSVPAQPGAPVTRWGCAAAACVLLVRRFKGRSRARGR
jgi:hypothetical protein